MVKLVEITPTKEFTFLPQSSNLAIADLKILNISSQTIAFKIKTTAPKNYIVKPNIGILPPSKSILISIVLSPIPPSVKDHKFMIQVINTHMEDHAHNNNLVEEFSNIKSLDGEQKDEYKLRVNLGSDKEIYDDKKGNDIICGK